MGEFKNRLKDLLEKEKIIKDQFCKDYYIGESSLKSYLNGNRQVPVETALKLAKKYNFTLDWFYCNSESYGERDIIIDTILAMQKVFRVRVVNAKYGCDTEDSDNTHLYTCAHLVIDKHFHEYLTDVAELALLNSSSVQTEEGAASARKMVLEKHKKILEKVFDRAGFNKDEELHVESVDDISIVDLL